MNNETKAQAVGVDYNTHRTRLVMPEYGRCVQQMVEHAKTIADRGERQRCAHTIVGIMANMGHQHGDMESFQQKLWNHLAFMSGYELDIDYPVEIERIDDGKTQHEPIAYPQTRIARRHYGAIVEALAKKIAEITDEKERKVLITQVANQMKRDLGRWNRDAMNDEKILEDLAHYTDGAVSLLPNDIHLIPDGEVLNDVQHMASIRKKKKK